MIQFIIIEFVGRERDKFKGELFMFDCRGIQGLSIIMGIISIIVAYASFFISLIAGDISMMFIGYILAMVIAVFGIVLGAASLREAARFGVGKARSIVGMALSAFGLVTNLAMCFMFGSTYYLASTLGVLI